MKIRCILFFLLPILYNANIWAQTTTVVGVITSATDNEPLPGVTVKIKNSAEGTMTGIDGEYSIKASPDAILEFSYIGFKSQEIKIEGRKTINVAMTEDALMLKEVVAVGYRTERKADLTGAVSVIDVKEMMSTPDNNAMKALQGRVAGMQVTNDGNPAGKATVRIRGIGTLNNNDPLYIIDGVPTTAGMHELNSNDIESIQVLRDASAASIYGSRAANGVIIVTTKKGKKGVLKVNFDAYLSVADYANKLKVLNSREYAQAYWQATVNSGQNPNNNGYGFIYKESTRPDGTRIFEDVYIPEFMYNKRGQKMRTSNTDWVDEITRIGFAQSYNLSVTNGTEKGNYFFSLGYYDNNGLVKETDFSRISARINGDYKLFNNVLTMGENLSINHTTEVEAPYQITEAALIAVPFIPVHTTDGKGWGGPTGILPDRNNPVRLLHDNKDNRYRYWRIFGNVFANINPMKGLNIRSNFGLDYSNMYRRTLVHSFVNGNIESDRNESIMQQEHWTRWTWTNTATYDFQIDKNRFETLLGMEMFRETYQKFAASAEGFASEDPDYMWPDEATGSSIGSGYNAVYSLMSYFGKIGYAYDEKYLASVTLRRDGSSRFGKNNRWGMFPAFNLGWRVSQETFMQKTTDYLSDLKLRFGWGQTGNQTMGNDAIYSIYKTDYGKGDPTWNSIWGTAYDIDGKGSGTLPAGFKRVQLANPDLKWETTTQTNIGLDFGFFDQSLYGSVEYYIKKTKDILYQPPYSGIKGEGANKYFNGAKMENKGFEFTLGYRGQTSFGLTYDLAGNFSTNKNKITHLPPSVLIGYGGNGKWDNAIGRPVGSENFYGWIADGIFRTQDEVDKHAYQSGKAIGRIRYRDLNNDGKIDDNDRTWIGDPTPDLDYGLNISLGYKNFDLTMYFQGINGIDIYSDLKTRSDFWSVSDTRSNKGRRLLDAFHPITNPNSKIPMLSAADNNNEARRSSYFVENGSYLKMRNLQVGYNIPKSVLDNIKIGSLRTYLSVQNVFTIHSKSFTGVDPENPAWGYPIPLTFTLGVNASF